MPEDSSEYDANNWQWWRLKRATCWKKQNSTSCLTYERWRNKSLLNFAYYDKNWTLANDLSIQSKTAGILIFIFQELQLPHSLW